VASHHERHPVFDDELLFLDRDFLYLFIGAQVSPLPESAQTVIELAMTLGQLLELFALSHENILGNLSYVIDQGLPSLHMAGPGLLKNITASSMPARSSSGPTPPNSR
jgi:hypothetical protein